MYSEWLRLSAICNIKEYEANMSRLCRALPAEYTSFILAYKRPYHMYKIIHHSCDKLIRRRQPRSLDRWVAAAAASLLLPLIMLRQHQLLMQATHNDARMHCRTSPKETPKHQNIRLLYDYYKPFSAASRCLKYSYSCYLRSYSKGRKHWSVVFLHLEVCMNSFLLQKFIVSNN